MELPTAPRIQASVSVTQPSLFLPYFVVQCCCEV